MNLLAQDTKSFDRSDQGINMRESFLFSSFKECIFFNSIEQIIYAIRNFCVKDILATGALLMGI